MFQRAVILMFDGLMENGHSFLLNSPGDQTADQSCPDMCDRGLKKDLSEGLH